MDSCFMDNSENFMARHDNLFVLANAFPIRPLHLLLVTAEHREELRESDLQSAAAFSRSFPQYALWHNMRKSGATRPEHVHFQALLRDEPMPIELAFRRELRKNEDVVIDRIEKYPAYGLSLRGEKAAGMAFRIIQELSPTPFNLVLINGEIMILPRNQEQPSGFSLFGGYEMGGCIVLTDDQAITFDQVWKAISECGWNDEQGIAFEQNILLEQLSRQTAGTFGAGKHIDHGDDDRTQGRPPARLMFKTLLPEFTSDSSRLFSLTTDTLRRVLVNACTESAWTLKQQDATPMTHATKEDVLDFDYALQSTLTMWIKKGLHRVAADLHISFLVSLLGEEEAEHVAIGTEPFLPLLVTIDPADGSTNLGSYLTAHARYREYLPKPDTGISLAIQIPDIYGDRYIAGAACDTATGTIYSSEWTGQKQLAFIDEQIVDEDFFDRTVRKDPKINVPFYSHGNVALLAELIERIQRTTRSKKIYAGRTRASIMDLIRMLAGDCDVMADFRALDRSDGNACLRPWDVCGMVGFMQGLGWMVADESGNPVNFPRYDDSVCFLVAKDHRLGHEIIETLQPLVTRFKESMLLK